MSDALSSVNSMVSTLNESINNAVSALKKQAAKQTDSSNVQTYQKTVAKSAGTARVNSTDIGILTKNSSRLNVVSKLAKGDNVDFYKFTVNNAGDNMAMTNVGGDGVRIQLMSRNGVVLADSDKSSGSRYEAYKKLTKGEYSAKKDTYTVRVSRLRGADMAGDKNYALQLSMGTYKKDYETVASQPTSKMAYTNTGSAGTAAAMFGSSSTSMNTMIKGQVSGGASLLNNLGSIDTAQGIMSLFA